MQKREEEKARTPTTKHRLGKGRRKDNSLAWQRNRKETGVAENEALWGEETGVGAGPDHQEFYRSGCGLGV